VTGEREPVSVLAAEYTSGGRTSSPTLDINLIEDGRRTRVSAHPVTGKRDARRLAIVLGATPWNF